MANCILAFFTPGPLEVMIILMTALFLVAIPVALVVLVFVFVTKGSKEREKLHQKMAELSDELKRTQEQLKEQKKG
jgi:cytochrome c-type biogenesis protein CcmH/NrfF